MSHLKLCELPPTPPDKTGWPWTERIADLADETPGGTPWPRLSIVTPSYNQGKYIEATIRSALLQGYPNLEYIIIDGGSTDESLSIIKKYEKHITYWVSESDGGHANALNKGFSRATGEVMAWINSDDFYLPGAFKTVAEVMAAFPEIEWMTSALQGWCGRDERVAHTYAPGFSRRFFEAGGYMGLPYSTAWIQQESTFWRRSLWLKAGGRVNEEISVAIDFELWSRFFRFAPLATVETALGCFRKHDEQRSRKQASVYRKEAMEAIGLEFPLLMSAAVGLYRLLGLGKIVHWRHLMKLIYGERAPIIRRTSEESWSKKTLWVA
jgi:glycosyltransferase involved in cell wall biosynthesis